MKFDSLHKKLENISIGTEKPRSYFIPYHDAESARVGDRTKSKYFKSLCGEWNFRFMTALKI